MLPQKWLLVFLIAGTATAMVPVSRQTMEESLKSALDAVTRKQRSLDANSQEYYNDLRSFKYRGGEGERKFDRERPDDNNRELEDEDEEIEFLPNEVGQLETVGNGFQDLNNKLLERALIDYLDTIPQQEEPVTSSFRERERTSNRKRGSDPLNVDNKELIKLFLEELQDGAPYNLGESDDEGYMDARQMLYDRYRADRGNKLYENTGPMSWGELMNKESVLRGQDREVDENEFVDQDQDPNLSYPTLAERRNVNGRYPIGRELGSYRSMAKRYPVAKRSPKPMPTKERVTDPKVAQDLGALFGTQSTDNQNHTHNHDHDHDHDHDHSHDHNHDHDHDEQHKHESSSEAPKASPPPKGQKENATKPNNSESIEVRKKSVDWSQYFGIDRRRKKANLMAGQGTQNQDDEWMLQRYYENMAENLKSNDYQKKMNERMDKLKQMYAKQKNIKHLMCEDALRYLDSEDNARVKYSLKKMRKALDEFRNNVEAQIEAQKIARSQNNQTSNFRENNNAAKASEKRASKNIVENEAIEENRVCPELEAIEERCRTAGSLAGDESQLLYLPCVKLQICKACVESDLEQRCLANYADEAGKICYVLNAREGQKAWSACASRSLMLLQLQPPAVSMQCRINGNESCLRRYLYHYLHSYVRYPFGDRLLSNGYETIGSQQMNR